MKFLRNILAIGLFSLALSIFAFAPKANAATFEAGRIIDDAIFNNKSAMSVGDIQNFLNSKVPTCDTWHTAGPSAQGANPPWTCLKNYYENTSTGANNLNGASIPSGAISAAQIIYNAAQTYNINPQVLIVTLQKENGLITDDWPYPWQYRTAMGFACPDNGSCDPAYYGFSKQVNQAARHFRNFYDQNPSWYIPYRPGVNYIQYNPNARCGGTNVNIQNSATAALYSYTPYQPNAAALNNLYGTGDGCSAYGNRNFWRDFTNWFGSTVIPPYSWQFVGQGGNTLLTLGEKATWTVTAKNTGSATWYNSGTNPVRISPSNPNDRTSTFCASGWIICSRAVNLNETSVAPGGIGTFTIPVQAPVSPGRYIEHFNLLAEGITWMNDQGLNFNTVVNPSTFSSSLVSINFPSSIVAGTTANISVVLKNTGSSYWYNNDKFPIRLGTTSPLDRISQFNPGNWLASTRLDEMNEAAVAPGQNGTFNFQIKAPATSGTYQESYGLLAESYRWFDQNLSFTVSVNGGTVPPPANGFISSMSLGQRLNSGQSLTSGDGKYKLVMQGDGNLVLYSPTRALWSSNTYGRSVGFFVLQGDGNMVIYGADNKPYWATWTQGRGASALYMQGDGNLVLYSPSFQAIWNSNTSGRI